MAKEISAEERARLEALRIKAAQTVTVAHTAPSVSGDAPTHEVAPVGKKLAKRGNIRFNVTSGLSQFSYGDDVYPVKDSVVELPWVEPTESWYQHFIDSGILTYAE